MSSETRTPIKAHWSERLHVKNLSQNSPPPCLIMGWLDYEGLLVKLLSSWMSRRVAEVFQRGFFFLEKRIFFQTEDVFLEKRISRTFFFLEKKIFFPNWGRFFFLVLLQRGVRLLQRGEFIRFKGGSFTTIEFQRGFVRTPRTPLLRAWCQSNRLRNAGRVSFHKFPKWNKEH